MTWFDFVVLGIMLVSGVIALVRGVVREVLTIAAWVGSGGISYLLTPITRPYVSRYVPYPEWTDPAATYILLFLISLIILSLTAKAIGHAVRSSSISGIDRVLGLGFGLARGAVLAIALYFIGTLLLVPAQWPEPVPASFSLPTICMGAGWVAQEMVAHEVVEQTQFWEKTRECPAQRQMAGDGILKPSPVGRATDPPIRR